VSRGRKRPKSRQPGQRVLRTVSEPCDCPACTGADFDPQELIDNVVADATDLLAAEDALDAELFGAAFLAAGELAGPGFAEALAESMVPAVAAFGTPESLAVLLALDAVDEDHAAAAAAQQLVDAGVPAPAWTAELREPVRVGQCQRFADSGDSASMLVCSFDRAGRSHGFVVHVDHTDCDAAADVLLFPAEILDEVLDTIRAGRPRGARPRGRRARAERGVRRRGRPGLSRAGGAAAGPDPRAARAVPAAGPARRALTERRDDRAADHRAAVRRPRQVRGAGRAPNASRRPIHRPRSRTRSPGSARRAGCSGRWWR
jgi:hypothetical protein